MGGRSRGARDEVGREARPGARLGSTGQICCPPSYFIGHLPAAPPPSSQPAPEPDYSARLRSCQALLLTRAHGSASLADTLGLGVGLPGEEADAAPRLDAAAGGQQAADGSALVGLRGIGAQQLHPLLQPRARALDALATTLGRAIEVRMEARANGKRALTEAGGDGGGVGGVNGACDGGTCVGGGGGAASSMGGAASEGDFFAVFNASAAADGTSGLAPAGLFGGGSGGGGVCGAPSHSAPQSDGFDVFDFAENTPPVKQSASAGAAATDDPFSVFD